MRVSVIIVNFNGKHLLGDCLSGIEAQTRPADEVLLVDNGSDDGSVDFTRRSFPWIRVIESEENLGFAGGNNLGIRSSTGDIVVLLNNDTLPGPGFIEWIVHPLETNQSWSAVAGVLLFSEFPEIVASSGIEVFDNGLALDKHAGNSWGNLDDQFEVFGASGGAAAFRRSVFEGASPFPEHYFLYLEDADLAWRMRLKGLRTVAVRNAWTLHAYSASSGQSSMLKDYYLARNRAWTLIRNWPRWLWRRRWWPVLKYEFGAVAYALARWRWRSISGRFRGWSAVFRLRSERARVQSAVTVDEDELLYWMRPDPPARSLLELRARIEELSRKS